MLQSCKHFPESKVLYGCFSITTFDGPLKPILFPLDHLNGTNYTKMFIIGRTFMFSIHVMHVMCNQVIVNT